MERLEQLAKAAADATIAVEIAYSPFEVMHRSCLNAGARKAAEVAVVNTVERAILARATKDDAMHAYQQRMAAVSVAKSHNFDVPTVHLTPAQMETTFDEDWRHSSAAAWVNEQLKATGWTTERLQALHNELKGAK